MIDLITLDEARAHIGVTFDFDDVHLADLITTASLMVLDHINGDADTYASLADVPANVKHAVRLLVSYFDENRSGENWTVPNMPPAIQALLSNLHTPVTR